jgi:MYXO-CTERM domain-containing protein
MPRARIIVAVLAALALAAPAASADPHAIDAAARAEKLDTLDSALQAELRARGRDGVPTGSLAGTTDATTRALAQERAYSSYGEPAPIEPAPAQATVADDDTSWPLIGAGFVGVALLLGLAVLLVARPRRPRVAT